jgi:hypothetical protein
MRKLLVLILTICLITSIFCITASAIEDPASDVVLRVRATKPNGDVVLVGDYKDIVEGWKVAMGYANDSDEMEDNGYVRIIIDLYTDWKAQNGMFCEKGDGFNEGALYFDADAKVTLNLNGHTINRGLTERRDDGEVIYINDDADIIINDGTIKGGYSTNGAGGIYIDDAYVTLNNVNVVGNSVSEDDGAGIGVYYGATLTMNGGSVSDNTMYNRTGCWIMCGAGIYIDDSKAYLKGVTFQNNQGDYIYDVGAAFYAEDSMVYMDDCDVIGNGKKDNPKTGVGHYSMIYCVDTEITVKNSRFTDNGYATKLTSGNRILPTNIFKIQESVLVMDNCKFTNNLVTHLLHIDDSRVTITNTDFRDGNSNAIYGNAEGTGNNITNCKFAIGSEEIRKIYPDTFFFDTFNAKKTYISGLNFVNCDFGEATFNHREAATFDDLPLEGSIVGEGSMTNILVIISLVVSGVSIFLTVYYNKKKAAPVAANNTTEAEE